MQTLLRLAVLLSICAGGAATIGCGDDSGPGSGSGSAAAGTGATGATVGGNAGEPEEPIITECNDGIDNDGDGLVDWQRDLGCANEADDDETAASREDEDGWTTFDPPASGKIFYVSAGGSDEADGLTPETSLATIQAAKELADEDGTGAWILLRRGDVFEEGFRITQLYGASSEDRVVFGSYGDSKQRPALLNARVGSIKTASNVAIVGLEVRGEGRDPESPAYVGPESPAGGSFVFSGENLLIEGCKFTFGQVSIIGPSRDALETLENVEFRRNVVYKAYSVDSHAQGLFASKINGLLIEGNVFDHDGWLIQQIGGGNDQDDGQATFFNHDMYLSSVDDVTVRDNLILRAASMGIKMRSDVTGGSKKVTIERNVFFDGELGVGIGGNTDEPDRFVDTKLFDNVFLHVGRSRPTNRGLAWAISVSGNDGSEIARNFILHQDSVETPNSYGVSLGSSTLRDIHVHDNVLYGLNGRGIKVTVGTTFENLLIEDNVIDDGGLGSLMVQHDGSLGAFVYRNNQYASALEQDEWFKVDGDSVGFATWQAQAGAVGSVTTTSGFVDPARDLATYNASLGGERDDLAFIERARELSPWAWDQDYTAGAVRAYIAAGFESK